MHYENEFLKAMITDYKGAKFLYVKADLRFKVLFYGGFWEDQSKDYLSLSIDGNKIFHITPKEATIYSEKLHRFPPSTQKLIMDIFTLMVNIFGEGKQKELAEEEFFMRLVKAVESLKEV